MAGGPLPETARLAPDAYLPTRIQWLAGFVLAVSNFMVVLDLSIANVSIPQIAGNLGITLDQGTWIITSYAVAEAICVPLTGWLAQRVGTVRLFLGAMLGFGLFSLLCGLSVSLDMLVICRIGQGLCGGPIMPMSQTLLTRVFPPEKRAVAIGMWAMTVTMGPAFGPIIGGTITDNMSWHWIFLINVPIALLATVAGYALLNRLETPTIKIPIDRFGLAIMIFWIGCLQIMLDIGRDHDWFGDWKIVLLAIMAAVGFLAFIVWELTEEHPVVDLRVFRHRGYWTAVTAFALVFGSYFASVVVIPQWLQVVMGYTATQAGLMVAFSAMAAVIGAPIAARLLPHVDHRILVTGAAFWMAAISFMRSFWYTGTDFWSMAPLMLVQGLALPFLMIALSNATMSSVLPSEAASGAGLQNFLRTIALAISTSLVLTLWSDHQRISRSEMVGRLNADGMLDPLRDAGFSPGQSAAMLANTVDREAMTIAMTNTFLFSAVALVFAGLIIWLGPRSQMSRLSAQPPAE